MTEPRTCPTGKARYTSQRLALVHAIRLVTRQSNAEKRRLGRTYRCPACHAWHITTQPRKAARP